MSHLNVREIGAYILAGGKSSRMGTDKGLISIFGKPMVEHVMIALRQVFSHITIISNNKDYSQSGLKVIPDLIPDHGPMGGVYTGLKDSFFQLNFFCSCDMPFINKMALDQLLDQAVENQITVPVVLGKVQPLFAVYPNSIINDLEQLIHQNRLKMVGMIGEFVHQKVYFDLFESDLQKQFRNINTKADLDDIALETFKNKI